MKALGMIEVKGRLAAVEALDNALKTANVCLVNMIRVGGGLTTVLVEGDVGAVKVAVASSAAAAQKVGGLISSHVIARPADSVRKMLSRQSTVARPAESERPSEKASLLNGGAEGLLESRLTVKPDVAKIDESDRLYVKRVSELRTIARQTKGISLTKKEIKFAKKDELIKAIRCAES